MVRKFAVAAAVIGVSAILLTQSMAKGGGGFGGMHGVQHARPPLYTGLAPNFRPRGHFGGHRFGHHRFFAGRHHHRRGFAHRGFAFGFPAVAYADPVIYEVPSYDEPAPGAIALWRGNGAGGCTAQTVLVHTSHGMDEVTITRC